MKKTLKLMAMLIALGAIVYSAPVTAKTATNINQPEIAGDAQPGQSSSSAPAVSEDNSVSSSVSSDIKEQPNYTIISGDVLQITVWKEDGLDQEVLVLPGGTIDFPLIGSVVAQGQTPAQLQATIKQKLHKFIPDAAVTVSVKAALGHTVSVIGQVTKPGEFVMGRHLTVMQALSQAGGLTPYASESSIIILRHDETGKEISIPFPYDDVADGDNLDKDIVLRPGDVVVVPTAGLL